MRQCLYILSVVLLPRPAVAADDSCMALQSTVANLAATIGSESLDSGPICRASNTRQSSMSVARAVQFEDALISQSYLAALDC